MKVFKLKSSIEQFDEMKEVDPVYNYYFENLYIPKGGPNDGSNPQPIAQPLRKVLQRPFDRTS